MSYRNCAILGCTRKYPIKIFNTRKYPIDIFFANIPDTRHEPKVFSNTQTRYTRKLKIPTRWALVITYLGKTHGTFNCAFNHSAGGA